MSHDSTISIVIPTYRHARLIPETLASVMAQTRAPDEIVIVDDGSTDATADVLRDWARDPRIRVIRQDNAGQAAARNTGWRAASGDYIGLLDDDDLLPPDKLQWQAQALDRDRDLVLVYGGHTLMLPGGELRREPLAGRPTGDVRQAFRRRNWIHSLGQTLIRRSALERVDGLDEAIWGSDDWDLLIRLADLGSFRYEPRYALHYRIHGANASRQAPRHAREHWRVALRHIGGRLPTLLANRRAAGRYFVPSLMRSADAAADDGQDMAAARACLWALSFHASPRLAARAARHLLHAATPELHRSAAVQSG